MMTVCDVTMMITLVAERFVERPAAGADDLLAAWEGDPPQ